MPLLFGVDALNSSRVYDLPQEAGYNLSKRFGACRALPLFLEVEVQTSCSSVYILGPNLKKMVGNARNLLITASFPELLLAVWVKVRD